MPDRCDLERLYDAHAQTLFAFVLQLTRDEADTRDVLQDLFIKIAKNHSFFDTVKDERGFLIRLAHNQAIDLMRRRGTRTRAQEQLGQASVELFAHNADPDSAEFQGALSAALEELPPDQRAVVQLKLWEGWTFEAIAESLQISLNTAASRYRYGIDKLRDRLRPLYDEIQ